MIRHKKTMALIMSLLICASAPVYTVYADNETEASTEASTVEEKEDTAEAPEENNIKESGGFKYTITEEGNACIEDYSGSEADVVIPETIDGYTVTELGSTALGSYEKYMYNSVTLPKTIEYISANGVFGVCTYLKEIKFDGENKHYTIKDGVLYTKDGTELVCYPAKKTGISFKVPEGVKKIHHSAFYSAIIEEITLPASVEEIGAFAFSSCEKLKKADLSKTKIEGIGEYTFSYCEQLTELLFPQALAAIGGAAFAGCESLTEVTLPENLSVIAQYAFVDTGLKLIEIPPSVTKIEYCAFGYRINKNTGYEVMDEGFIIVGEYGSAAFEYATDSDSEYDYANNFQFRTFEQQEELKMLEGLVINTSGDYQYAEIDGGIAIVHCFANTPTITVPAELDGKKITNIYPSAFSGSSVTDIIISEGITTINKQAFTGCPKLKSITLPQSITFIDSYAFEDCIALEKIDLGGAVTIGTDVFRYCSAIKEITFSGNCEQFGIEGEDPFYYLISLENINVTDGDGSYASKDGVLYNNDKTVLIHYPKGKTAKKFTVPDGVKEIAHDAFYRNSVIEEVDLSGVEIIGLSGFEHCENLSSVKLSKKLKKLDVAAFYDCTKLKELRLYTSDTEIADLALGYYYNTAKINEDGTNGGSEIIDGFKLYTKKSKNDTGVTYAKDNGITVVTNTVELFGKNVREEILWICGGGIGVLLAAIAGSAIVKKSKKKKASAPADKPKKEKKEKKDKKSKGYENISENNEEENKQ